MRTVCAILLVCSLKEVISAEVVLRTYDVTKNKRMSTPLASRITSTAMTCCATCQISGTCDSVAYNKVTRVCEQGQMDPGDNSLAPGWDLYAVIGCPAGWEYYDRSCVMLETNTLSWEAAQTNCNNKANGGRLAYVKTEEKNGFLISLIKNKYPAGSYKFWIGAARDRSDMAFYWGDGTPLSSGFTYWYPREPSNWGGAEDCVMTRTAMGFQWNDGFCSKKIFSVCEY